MHTAIFLLAAILAANGSYMIKRQDDNKISFTFSDINFVNDYLFEFKHLQSDIILQQVEFNIQLQNSFCNTFSVQHTDIVWTQLCSANCTGYITGYGQKANALIVKSLGPSMLDAVITFTYELPPPLTEESSNTPIFVFIVVPFLFGVVLIVLIVCMVVSIIQRRKQKNFVAQVDEK